MRDRQIKIGSCRILLYSRRILKIVIIIQTAVGVCNLAGIVVIYALAGYTVELVDGCKDILLLIGYGSLGLTRPVGRQGSYYHGAGKADTCNTPSDDLLHPRIYRFLFSCFMTALLSAPVISHRITPFSHRIFLATTTNLPFSSL